MILSTRGYASARSSASASILATARSVVSVATMPLAILSDPRKPG